MPNFRLTLEYDGADFAGWQAQRSERRTVQETLEGVLARLTGSPARVCGAGRTDAGVHAEGQVASVALATALDPAALQRALNGLLPADLAVVDAERASDDFDARFEARGKRYRYRVWNAPHPSPLRLTRAHWVRRPLDLAAMRDAAAALVGTHDFASCQAAGSGVTSSVRSLRRLDVEGAARGEVRLLVEGDGFLRHMVRILAGTLLEVGVGRRAAGGMAALLAARDRRRAGPTAPARALTLVRVFY